MKYYFKYILSVILSTIQPIKAQDNISKEGGICFRIDDNGLISQYRDYVDIFEKHGQKFTFAMNLGNVEFESFGYPDSIRKFQNLGHELLDHTPNHRTNYFFTKFDSLLYKNTSGVDHNIGNKICLKHENVDTLLAERSNTATIIKDTIYFSDSVYSALNKLDEKYFYFPSLDSLVLVDHYSNNQAHFTDIWDDTVNLGTKTGIKYFTFKKQDINLTSSALGLLSAETKKMAENLYNLGIPKVWIQPGGNFPMLHSYEIKAPFEANGYTSGATYPMAAKKVYNEYNLNNDKQFAIQWGDFVETDTPFSTLKRIIADGIAKHKVLIGNAHWYSDGSNEWNNYILRNDSLLTWATSNSIPIKTYSEWNDLLYVKTPDPYENIIPPFNVDKDSNGTPDGYGSVFYPISNLTGQLISDTTIVDSMAFQSTYLNEYKQITHILNLGGIEKGENSFSVWTKGSQGNSLRVVFSAPWPGSYSEEFKIPANTPNWTKFDLSQSINGNTSLNISDTISVLNVDLYHSATTPQTIWVGGMHMAKKIEYNNLKLRILNNSPYLVNEEIKIEVSLCDEFGDPAITSYEYKIDIPDSSSAELLTTGILNFTNTSKDTIIVKDSLSEVINLKAMLINDTTVVSTINLPIEHTEKKLNLFAFLEGAFDTLTNNMGNGLINYIPTVSPYISAPDTINQIPEGVVDWVLVTLRKDIDEQAPNPQTAIDVTSKSALIKKGGKIIGPHSQDHLDFRVPTGNYYIVLKHKNHLPIMSSSTIFLDD